MCVEGVLGGMRGAGVPFPPPRPTARGRTGEVELVQAVVGHGGVSGALSDVGRGRRVGAKPPGPGGQPAAHPEPLEQVPQEAPEQAAGQVPVGGGQGPAQCPQGRPQVLGTLGEIPLRPPGERAGQRGGRGHGGWVELISRGQRCRGGARRDRRGG